MTPAEVVVVSPDVGGVARARGFAKRLADAPLAIVDKRRQAHNVAKVYNLIGDVEGKVALLVDDMIDTAGTLSAAASLLRDSVSSGGFANADPWRTFEARESEPTPFKFLALLYLLYFSPRTVA